MEKLSLLRLAGRLGPRAGLERRSASRARSAPCEDGFEPVAKGPWVIFPPVPTVPKSDGLLHCLQEHKSVTAIAWLKRCCPQISQNDAETLFRSGKVKIHTGSSQLSKFEKLKLRRIGRKETLSEGSVLCLPTHCLHTVNLAHTGKKLNTIPDMDEGSLEMSEDQSLE